MPSDPIIIGIAVLGIAVFGYLAMRGQVNKKKNSD